MLRIVKKKETEAFCLSLSIGANGVRGHRESYDTQYKINRI